MEDKQKLECVACEGAGYYHYEYEDDGDMLCDHGECQNCDGLGYIILDPEDDKYLRQVKNG